MGDSILETIAKLLSIQVDDNFFDVDLVLHINSAISALTDLGVGPDNGYAILSREETWEDYLGDDIENLGMVQEFIYLKVKLLFNTPQSSSVIKVYEDRLNELQYKLYARKQYGEKKS